MARRSANDEGFDQRLLQDGIEWIVARQVAPIEKELLRLRTYVEGLRAAIDQHGSPANRAPNSPNVPTAL